MKKHKSIWLVRSFYLSILSLLLLSGVQRLCAQGYGAPLTIQGLDRSTIQSATSRAVGGITIGMTNDAGLMFSNPALLQSLEGIQISLGGIQQNSSTNQVQQYGPFKYYSNFSLLMEGLTGIIPNVRYIDTVIVGTDTVIVINPGATPGDTVQRPYDDIGPNWSRKKNQTLPVQALLAFPFSIGESKFAAGVGMIQYADLNQYYQNNNVLSPSILSERPSPTPRPTDDSAKTIKWSQFVRAREGWLRGYGAAISGSLTDKLSFGISGMLIRGSTDDFEQHIARGNLTFYSNYFRIDSVYGRTTRMGTSEYSGTEITVSGIYQGSHLSLGFSLKPPTTITRKYSTQVSVDTNGAPSVSSIVAQDKLKLPWRGTIGISLLPVERLRLGIEYEIRSYASARYTQSDGTQSTPWLSSSVFHIGAEYKIAEWLALRAGIRGQSEVFEPEGNALVGEPVTYSIYSAGTGISFGSLRLNIAYEYGLMKYQDVWGSAISFNSNTRHSISADISYQIPWNL